MQTQKRQTNTSSASNKNSDDVNNRAPKEAVGYLLMLLRDAYPAQFSKAYPSEDARLRARGIWTAALTDIHPQRIKKAAEKAIRKENKFMPSLGDIIALCRISYDELGLKEPLQAYYEACNMESPDVTSPWSHAAVYFAGKATGWSFLRSELQERSFPLFESNYALFCQAVQNGEDLSAKMINKQLENFAHHDVISQTERRILKKQQQLMQTQGIDPESGKRAFQEEVKKLYYPN